MRRATVPLYGAFCGRPVGLLFSGGGTFHPFIAHPSYQPLRKLSAEERYRALLDPAVRAKLLSEQPYGLDDYTKMKALAFHKMFRLGPRPDYEPDPAGSAAAVAAARAPAERGRLRLDAGGRRPRHHLLPVFNFSYEKLSHTQQLLQHPRTMLSLGDGGATAATSVTPRCRPSC